MAKFKMGEEVRQIITIPQGVIVDRKVDGDDDLFLVSWTDESGEHERWFREDEIELVGV